MRRSILSSLFVALCFVSQSYGQAFWQMQNGEFCPPEGQSTSGHQLSEAKKAANRLKNRFDFPTQTDIDSGVTLGAMLAPDEDDRSRWEGVKAGRIAGWVVSVKASTGGESCNCGAHDPIDCDTHIDVALTPDAENTEHIIVEVTPRIRQIMAQNGVDWSSETLRNPQTGIKGKWVEFTGWMFFDTDHLHEAENTNPGGSRNWRASCWELHPVTSIVISSQPHHHTHHPLSMAIHNSRDELRGRVRRDPTMAARIAERNTRAMAAFGPQELDDDQRATTAAPTPAAAAPQIRPQAVPPSPNLSTIAPQAAAPGQPFVVGSVPAIWIVPDPCCPPLAIYGCCEPRRTFRRHCR